SLQTRPRFRHARSASRLGIVLGGPFDRGVGGPGGWIILDEPELHLGADIVVSDLAGWRRETMPEMPDDAYGVLRPDWACEVLSPSAATLDRAEKLPIYAREGVQNVWFVDPEIRALEVFTLDGETFRLTGTWRDHVVCRAQPFDAIELSLEELWSR